MPPHDVVCFSSADWDAPLWTNKQHLMSRLAAAGVRVLYVDSLGLRRPRATSADSSRIARRLARWRPLARPAGPNVLRDSPLVLPVQSRVARALNAGLLRTRLARNIGVYGLRRPVVWTYVPLAARLYDPRRHAGLVYHCVDRLSEYPGVDADAFDREERRLVEAADVVLASSKPLAEHAASLGAREVVYWPNPADVSAFSEAPRGPAHSRPLAGFAGALDPGKVDFALLSAVAAELPGWDFELVGPASGAVPGLPGNVRLRGHVRREELPAVVSRFDVALVPYLLNGYTNCVFPMKVFEYLAAGLPVVSTPLPSLVGEVEHVSFAGTAGSFVGRLLAELDRDSAGRRRERSAYAESFSWEARTEQALDLLGRYGEAS